MDLNVQHHLADGMNIVSISSKSALPVDQKPFVSIVMATFNSAPTLSAALDSIANQTYQNWELIVCDDASTDETLIVLRDFAKAQGERVKILRNFTNRRLAYSLNKCLKSAKGAYIARMDADDISLPQRLQCQVTYLTRNPQIDVVGSWMQRFNSDGVQDVVAMPPAPNRWSMRHGVPFAHATIMARREVYESLNGYTVSNRTARGQDRDLWFRFFAAGMSGANLTDVLYLVREDEAAIQRRTSLVRWNAYRTAILGHKMLGYPRHWLFWPTLALLKVAVPTRLVLHYRTLQARRAKRAARSV